MTYYDIIRKSDGDKALMWQEVKRISDFLETAKETHKELVESFLSRTECELSGHFNEELAKIVVSRMKPIMGVELNSFMEKEGLTPEAIWSLVNDVEQETIDKYAETVKLPNIPKEYNKFDYYVCMAEKLDHNYATIDEDMAKGALLVYEALSDYDGGTRKVWDKMKHYLDY